MASKKMKYASMAGVGLMTMSLVACANTDEQGYIGDSFEIEEAMQSNGVKTINQSQFDGKCEEYELQSDGSYVCDNDDDDDDGYTGSGAGMFWFFNGHTYSSHNAMVASSDYKKHNLKTGTSIPTETKNKFNNDARINSKNNTKNKSNTGGSNNPKNGSSSKGSSGKSSGFGSGARGGSSGGS